SSMKRWVYGGAPLGAKEVAFVKQRFQTDRLTAVYGLTEGGPSGTLLRPEEHDEKAGSIGKYACLYTELNIVDETCRTVRSEEHTSELQSRFDLVCRLLLEKKM